MYLTKHLRYSESSAYRRLTTARVIGSYPMVIQYLKSKEVNLSTVSLISGILSPKNVDAVLERILGKSQKEVELLVAGYKEPKKAILEVIKPVTVKRSVEVKESPLFEVQTDKKVNDFNFRCGSKSETPVEEKKPEVEELYKVSFGADKEFMGMLNRIREVSGARGVEEALKKVMEFYLAKKAPEVRKERREKRAEAQRTPNVKQTGTRTRAISVPLRDKILVKDNCQCSYISPDGVRCTERHKLQIDHVKPYALGGEGTEQNLRVLCPTHNRLAAEYTFGKDHMRCFGRDASLRRPR